MGDVAVSGASKTNPASAEEAKSSPGASQSGSSPCTGIDQRAQWDEPSCPKYTLSADGRRGISPALVLQEGLL